MSIKSASRYAVLFVFSLILFWIIGVTPVVKASTLIPDGFLKNGDVIENDVFATGEQVLIDGTIQGDAILLGNQVKVTGNINGSLFVIGQNVEILGQVEGSTYVGAVALKLGSQSVLQNNLYFAGVSLTTLSGSAIQRDLRTVCLSADLDGQVSRDTKAVIGILKFIERLIEKLGGEALFSQSLPPGGFASMSGMGGVLPVLTTNLLLSPALTQGVDPTLLREWLLDKLRDFGLLLFLGLIFYWLWRENLNTTARHLRMHPLAALGYGLLALILVFNIFLAGILVAILLFMIGLWIGNWGLWEFTLAFWVLAYAALFFCLAVLWFLVAYGTKVVAAYLISSWLFEKVFPKAAIHPLISIVSGLLLYVLLCSIPTLGWVLGVLATAWGLGGFWLAYRKWKKE